MSRRMTGAPGIEEFLTGLRSGWNAPLRSRFSAMRPAFIRSSWWAQNLGSLIGRRGETLDSLSS